MQHESPTDDQRRQALLERLRNDHTYHRPEHPAQAEFFEQVRAKALELGEFIVSNSPMGREQSSALTRIEEAVFHANAGCARNPNFYA